MMFRFERIHHAPGQYRYYLTGDRVNGVIEDVPSQITCRQLRSSGLEQDFGLAVVRGVGSLGAASAQIKPYDGVVRTNMVASYNMGGGDMPIYSCAQKGNHIFDGFSFFHFPFAGKKIDVYEVGFGRKGIYWCVYADGVPVTVFSMDMPADGYGSGYTVYCDDGVQPELIAMIGVLMDITHNPSSDGYNRHRSLNTWQKALKEKYPAAFMMRHQPR